MATATFSGLASGIDSASLIESIIQQKRKALISPLETRISTLEETNNSFSELTTLLSKLQTAASAFRELNGGIIAKNLTSSDEASITGTAANSASAGSYSINVSQLAKNATHSFDDRFASDSTILNSAINNSDPAIDRTVTYTIGTGAEQETVNIELTNTTTASQFVQSFNSQSERASASLVNVGTSASPSYAIVINSDNQGTTKGQIAVSVGARITDPNADLSTADGVFLSETTSAATDAQFTVTGISGTISRSSNTINDVISGVTLNLQSTGSSTITISGDSSRTASSIQDFVDAYNDVVEYINENDTVTREEDGAEVRNIFGPLANTAIDNNILSVLRSALSAAGTSGRTVNIFADLGVTTSRDGTLEFDTEVLDDALASDSDGVALITQTLGESLASVDGQIAQFIRFNGLIDVAESANIQSITNANVRISDLESLLSKEEASLNARFSRLEALIGQLNSQQSALAASLPR